jgi:hypothetical protein
MFDVKKRYFYDEMYIWFKDLFNSNKEFEEMLLKNTKSLQEKLSRGCVSGFSECYKPFLNSISQDSSTGNNFSYVKFYASKY